MILLQILNWNWPLHKLSYLLIFINFITLLIVVYIILVYSNMTQVKIKNVNKEYLFIYFYFKNIKLNFLFVWFLTYICFYLISKFLPFFRHSKVHFRCSIELAENYELFQEININFEGA